MAAGPRLAGRIALITGGGGETGGALARRFAVEAAAVAVADIDPAKSKAVLSAIPNGGWPHRRAGPGNCASRICR